MAHYLIRYSLGPNNEYVYPAGVAGVVWKSTQYHATAQVMVGETDASVKANGKTVIALTADRAAKLVTEHRASYPWRGGRPDQGLPGAGSSGEARGTRRQRKRTPGKSAK